ncbi:hypothetical protein AcV7_003604 [Taiwanofungus camphoratus]|nr:hypothetical protein AcV7_003604 [Antrodia cinnamomea]
MWSEGTSWKTREPRRFWEWNRIELGITARTAECELEAFCWSVFIPPKLLSRIVSPLGLAQGAMGTDVFLVSATEIRSRSTGRSNRSRFRATHGRTKVLPL